VQILSHINLVDLKREFSLLREDLLAAIENVLENMRLYEGENIKALEREFAAFCQAKYGVAVGSGTDALLLALLACNVGPGDEVITVSQTFIATVAAIIFCGAKPVFVDIDPQTYTLDVSQLEEVISGKTRAIIPVHLYGHPANMIEICSLAEAYQLRVIEDACQAHGATYEGRKVGSFGDAGCFSFIYTKNLGAYGEAGMVVTNDEEIRTVVQELRDHGRVEKNLYRRFGLNCRMDELQAAIIRVKLQFLEKWQKKRSQIAKLYRQYLAESRLKLPIEGANVKHAYHQFVVRDKNRDLLRAWLWEKGISTGIHYPIPSHLQPACAGLGYRKGSLPETEKLAAECLSLPIHPFLKESEVEYICQSILNFSRKKTA
jgi:dTDP-4-amino-4,6-dideoxygalactose transaminase